MAALLAAATGCAAPESGQAGEAASRQEMSSGAASATTDTAPVSGPAAADGAAGPGAGGSGAGEEGPEAPQAPTGDAGSDRDDAATPAWWSDQPVRRGGEVSVCAEATAPTLREARKEAIRVAYQRLEAELGEPAPSASIGSEYEATQAEGSWRFRVRVTGAAEK